MKQYNIYLIDVFTEVAFGGNPAGVVFHNDELSEEEMQAIAKEMNQSETAFVSKINNTNYKVRFFTPVEEVDLCGHATIATFWGLATLQHVPHLRCGGHILTQSTKAGDLKLYIDYDDNKLKEVTMAQPAAEFLGELKDIDKLCEAFHIEPKDIGIVGVELPLSFVSTGIKDLMLPVKDKETLMKMKLNPRLLDDLSCDEDFYSVHAFTFTGKEEVTQRNFCPRLGIDEEAATGTSTGALLAHLDKHGVLKEPRLVAHQGENMGRPAKLVAKIVDGEIRVGGQAKITMEGILSY